MEKDNIVNISFQKYYTLWTDPTWVGPVYSEGQAAWNYLIKIVFKILNWMLLFFVLVSQHLH